MIPPLRLARGCAGLELLPGLGGAVAAFWWDGPKGRFDWLRPTSPEAAAGDDSNLTACYPLVPFFGRIRDGRLDTARGPIHLRLNRPGIPHAVHGHGWQAAWTVEHLNGADASLVLIHERDDWPWRYAARQTFALDESGGLRLELEATNLDDAPMPIGLGLHTFFPRVEGAAVQARLTHRWTSDPQLMPLEREPLGPDLDFSRGLAVDDLDLDHVFEGWDGTAVISLPRRGRLHLRAEPPPGFAVVVARPGRSFFVFEPVTHNTDAFNRAASGEDGTGAALLAPGESRRLTLSLRPEVEPPSP